MKLRTVERHPTWKLGERLILSDVRGHSGYRIVEFHGTAALARRVSRFRIVELVLTALENVRWFLRPPSDHSAHETKA